MTADNFNVCKSSFWPARDLDPALKPLLGKVLLTTPAPGLATGRGSLPRFRSELGSFIGVVPAVRMLGFNHHFVSQDDQPLGIGAIEMALRIGMGLEGVLNQSGDGLVFLDICTRVDGSSTNKANTVKDLLRSGLSGSAIPSRSAYYLRIRMPFWLIPFDLLAFAPVLLIVDPDLYAQMAVQSANGGLIPWQAGIATPLGRFQFILGREVGMSLYGLGRNKDVLALRGEGNENTLIQYQSTQFDFPIVEYRPFRMFSTDQSSGMVVQFSFGFDYPHHPVLILPEDVSIPDMDTIWYLGIRIAFDWRYYW